MLLQTNSYIVPKERRAEHARLLRRFRQVLLRLGCDLFEVYEQMGPNWSSSDPSGRFVQIMRFRDRKHQRDVHAAEQSDPAAQQLISEFCELINLPYQQQQGMLAIGYYQGVIDVPAAAIHRQAAAAAAAPVARRQEQAERQSAGGFGFGTPPLPAVAAGSAVGFGAAAYDESADLAKEAEEPAESQESAYDEQAYEEALIEATPVEAAPVEPGSAEPELDEALSEEPQYQEAIAAEPDELPPPAAAARPRPVPAAAETEEAAHDFHASLEMEDLAHEDATDEETDDENTGGFDAALAMEQAFQIGEPTDHEELSEFVEALEQEQVEHEEVDHDDAGHAAPAAEAIGSADAATAAELSDAELEAALGDESAPGGDDAMGIEDAFAEQPGSAAEPLPFDAGSVPSHDEPVELETAELESAEPESRDAETAGAGHPVGAATTESAESEGLSEAFLASLGSETGEGDSAATLDQAGQDSHVGDEGETHAVGLGFKRSEDDAATSRDVQPPAVTDTLEAGLLQATEGHLDEASEFFDIGPLGDVPDPDTARIFGLESGSGDLDQLSGAVPQPSSAGAATTSDADEIIAADAVLPTHLVAEEGEIEITFERYPDYLQPAGANGTSGGSAAAGARPAPGSREGDEEIEAALNEALRE